MTTKPKPVTVEVEPGTRLDQLIAAYAEYAPQAKLLAARVDELKTAIKAELARPSGASVTAKHPAAWLQLSYVERWDLDAKRMKAEAPDIYVTYARKGGRWELREVSAGGE